MTAAQRFDAAPLTDQAYILITSTLCLFSKNGFVLRPSLSHTTNVTSAELVINEYRLPESAVSLNMVIDTLNSLLKFTQMPGNHALFTAITPSLGHIVPVFPQLAPLVSALMLRISSVTRAQLAMNCLDARPQGSRERRLVNAVERVLSSRVFTTD
ncbi:hypothetical protein OSTOST_20155 [Ostertagia ostertagi]